MVKQWDGRVERITYEKLKTFDDLLNCPTKLIVYDEPEGFGWWNVEEGDCVQRKETFFHKHVYFNLRNSVFEPTIVTRDNFHTCGYRFFKKVRRVIKGRKGL